MSAAKRSPADWALREKLGELGHVLAIVAALVDGAVAIGARGGDVPRALVSLRLLTIEAASAITECKELHRAVLAVVNGDTEEQA